MTRTDVIFQRSKDSQTASPGHIYHVLNMWIEHVFNRSHAFNMASTRIIGRFFIGPVVVCFARVLRRIALRDCFLCKLHNFALASEKATVYLKNSYCVNRHKTDQWKSYSQLRDGELMHWKLDLMAATALLEINCQSTSSKSIGGDILLI